MKHDFCLHLRRYAGLLGWAFGAWLALALPAQASLQDNGDSTVTDTVTGLMWDQCAWGLGGPNCTIGTASKMNWQNALKQAVTANDSVHKGYRDWRLPSVRELATLAVTNASGQAIDTTRFPNTPSMMFWSSTNVVGTGNAWYVDFSDGAGFGTTGTAAGTVGGNTRTVLYPVRLVRGGQATDLLAGHTVGGSVIGLAAGASVVLRNNGGDDLTLSVDGSFTFASPVAPGNAYAVTVQTQPANPPQTCTVTNGSGTVGATNVTNVAVNCVTHSYAVTGSASPVGAGNVSCPPNPVTHGQSATCMVSTNPGYTLSSVSSDTCGGSLSGSRYTTGAVTAACTVSAQFLINQTITGFTANPPNPVYAPGGSFTVSATASSGLPVSFASNTPTVCTVSGSTVTMVSAGTCTLTADQAGNASYTPAPQVLQNVAIDKASQTLTFPAQSPASHTFAQGGTFTISPLATSAEPNSGNAISYSSLTTGVCTVSGSTVTMVSAGTCTLAADQAGNADYADATQVTQNVAIGGRKSFSGSTVPANPADAGPATAGFIGGGDSCGFDVGTTAFIAAPAAPPAGHTLPQGMFRFKLIGCDTTPVTMRVSWPQAVTGYTKYGKESAGATDSTYFSPEGLNISGHSVSFTVQDGQKGDDDWAVNGEIVDPTGPIAAAIVPPVGAVTPVPTLGEWGLMLLGLLAAGLGARRLRLKAR